MTSRARIVGLLTAFSLLAWALHAQAAITVTVLDAGTVTTSNTFTTASVTSPAGNLLLLWMGLSTTGCETSTTITGLGVSWTNVVRSTASTATTRVERALSIGNTGTVQVTFGGSGASCRATSWVLMTLANVDTTTNQGVVTNHTANLTGSSNCAVGVTLGSYASPTNSTVGGWTAESSNGTYTFAKDPDTGWVASAQQNDSIEAFATQWLIVRGSDNSADGSWTTPGTVNCTLATVEVQAATTGVKHRVIQQ